MIMQMWEILVPTMFNDGRPIKLRYHQQWDKEVRDLTGGLTIMRAAVGQWTAPNGTLYKERVIPVRIACTEDQIQAIINLTMDHYEQLAICAYRVSDNVIISHASEDTKEYWRTKNKLGMKNYDWLD